MALAPLTQILNHAALAVSRLAAQFVEAPLLKGLITAVANEVQTLEDGLYAILLTRDIENATGQTLIGIGDLVGAPAKGNKSTEQYRNRIKVQIQANRSQGTAAVVYTVAKAIITEWDVAGSPRVIEDPGGLPTYTVGPYPENSIVNVTADARELGRVLDDVNPAGVRGIVLSQSIESADAFCFANGPGKGFGEGAFVGAYDSGKRNY